MGNYEPAFLLQQILEQLQIIAGAGGGGSPSDPLEVDILRVNGTAVTNPLPVEVRGVDFNTGTPVGIAVEPFSGNNGGGVYSIPASAGGDAVQVGAAGTVTESSILIATHDPSIGITTGAAVTTNADGTLQQYLRGLVVHFVSLLARLPATLGQKVMASSLAVTIASDQTAVPTKPDPSTTANTPSIVTAAATDAFAANAARKVWSIQNMGTNTLYVRLGTAASTTVFHFALKPGTVNDDGNGGFISDEIWKGIVSYAGTSPRFVYSELT